MKRVFAVNCTSLIVLALITGASGGFECEAQLKLQDAIAASWRAAALRGYESDALIADGDELNTRWNGYLSSYIGPGRVPIPFRIEAKLAGRQFWAILIGPRPSSPPRTGPSVWVFVDRCSGAVIDVLENG